MNLKLNRTQTSPRLSEVAIAQVHDLPASVIDSLVLSASLNLIQRLSRHRSAVSEAWNSVGDVMGRAGMQTVEDLERKLPELSNSEREFIQQWVKRKTEMDDALERFKLIYRIGKEQADDKLACMKKVPALKRKIALKHPQLLKTDEIQEETALALLAHLLHSTVENGESGTTEVRFRLGRQSATDEIIEALPRVRIRQPLVARWTEAIARDDRFNEGFSFKVNDGLISQNGKAGLLVADGSEVGGAPTVHEYIYPIDGQAAGHLKQGAVRKKKDWIRSLQGEGGKAKFQGLLSNEILVPVMPEKLAAMCPLQGLASLVARIDSPGARRLRRSFLFLEVLLDRMGNCSPNSLPALRERAARAVNRIQGVLPVRLTGRLAEGDWFTEEQFFNERPIGLPDSVREDLETYAKDPGVAIVRSSITDVMTGWFADQYGHGGECSDVLGFLTHCAYRLDAAEEAKIAEEDAGRAASGAHMYKQPGPSVMAPHGVLSFRVAARSEQAMKRGDYQILAECRPGGALFEDEQWVRELLPDAEPLWFSYGSGWTGWERRYHGRQLLWPTDRQYVGISGQFLTLPNLKIVHDQETGTLVIVGPEGTPVAPVYTGNIPVHQLPDAVRLFLKVTNPWVCVKNGRSGGMSPGYSQRQTEGRMVTAPAQWRISTEDVLLREAGEPESDYFLRLHDWRVRKGIPQEAMFAVVDSKYPAAACNGGKERYVHFGSPRLIGRFTESLTDGDLLILTEVFPERGAHAIGRSGQPCVTDFRVAVKWV